MTDVHPPSRPHSVLLLGGAYLKFVHEGSTLVVFTGIGKGWRKEGLVVSAPGKEPVELPCRSEWTSEIGPELFDSAGIPADPEGFEIPFE